jgi:hypothetical protein
MNRSCAQCGAGLQPGERFCRQCGAPTMARGRGRDSGQKRRGQRLNISLFMLIAGVLLLAGGGAFYLAGGGSSPSATPLLPGPRTGGIPYPEVERVSLAEAKAGFDDGSALFLDVRIRESYELGHIANAISMPLAVLSTRHEQLAGAEMIFTYCT